MHATENGAVAPLILNLGARLEVSNLLQATTPPHLSPATLRRQTTTVSTE